MDILHHGGAPLCHLLQPLVIVDGEVGGLDGGEPERSVEAGGTCHGGGDEGEEGQQENDAHVALLFGWAGWQKRANSSRFGLPCKYVIVRLAGGMTSGALALS